MQNMKKRKHPAAIFLIAVATIIVLVIGGFIWASANPIALLRLSFTPGTAIAEETFDATPDYNSEFMWVARPGQISTALTQPLGITSITEVRQADVFFVYPTTYLNAANWNAPLDDVEANQVIETTVLKNIASVYNIAGEIYAPRYRQATFGAFFDETGQGQTAIERAREDVYAAFDYYIKNINRGRPFILAGHSQGALHALNLLKDRITKTALREQMIAAYIIGWHVSIEEDLDVLADIDACQNASDTGCVISYQSVGIDGDSEIYAGLYESAIGLSGKPKKRSKMLCTNPLDWNVDSAIDRASNKGGVLLARFDTPLGEPIPLLTGAKCDELGILRLTEPPQEDWREYVMAGDNYHVYDYNLFYMNIRENAALRAQAWLSANND